MMERHLVICCMAEETHRFLQETDWKERLVNDSSLNAELIEADIKNDFSCTSLLHCVDLMTAFLKIFSLISLA